MPKWWARGEQRQGWEEGGGGGGGGEERRGGRGAPSLQTEDPAPQDGWGGEETKKKHARGSLGRAALEAISVERSAPEGRASAGARGLEGASDALAAVHLQRRARLAELPQPRPARPRCASARPPRGANTASRESSSTRRG
ncbi:unnamed protein product [Prorocentrum cordatum]|uniref:Uncharacterized protein n=1 Tax=Prorocentrum cordatum TaxID=2364126 RepID=A0ABN9WKV5_9DINO|nr:unnamed protein product [Polarella glacialis]